MSPSLQPLVEQLQKARQSAKAIPALTQSHESLSLADGYQIQQSLLESDLHAGERLVGYKMGLTSLAKQRDVNVFEPIRGYLLSSMEIPWGAPLSVTKRIHPRVEPEVAFVFRDRVFGRATTARDIMAAVSGIYPAVEILDSRYEGFRFNLPEVVADNTSAAGFIIGITDLTPRFEEIRLMGVCVRRNGVVETTGCPAAVLGHPICSVVELARGLAKDNLAIEAGMVVLTGGITASLPVETGDCIEMVWPMETVSITVTA